MPSIWQGFEGKPQRVEAGIAFDRRLYVARRVFEHRVAKATATYVYMEVVEEGENENCQLGKVRY